MKPAPPSKCTRSCANLVAQGRLGRKASAGFYKKTASELLVYDVKTTQYRSQEKVRFDSLCANQERGRSKKRLKSWFYSTDIAAKFAWSLARTHARVQRAAARRNRRRHREHRPSHALGFNWDLGPFEALDAIGVSESVAKMKEDGIAVPAWVKRCSRRAGPAFMRAARQPDVLRPAL